MENDLKFTGEEPVVINYNGSADDIYAPIRTSSSDINLVHTEILDDLYTAQKDNISVKIEKGTHQTEKVVILDDQGSVQSLNITPEPPGYQNYKIHTNNLFYVDIYGDFRFNGEVKDIFDMITPVNLLYNVVLNKWEHENSWGLENGDWYFHNGTDSYKIHWDGTRHYIQKRTTQGWGSAVPYNKVDQQGGITDCGYGVENIIKTINGGMELVWGTERYFWNSSDMEWEATTPYADEDQESEDYFGMYGETHQKIKDKNGVLIDTCVVEWVYGQQTDWLCRLDPTNSEFKKIIPLEDQWEKGSLFTDDEGNLFFQRNDGVILFWVWEAEQWVEWVKFEDTNIIPTSFFVDYVIPGNHKRVVVKYTTTNSETKTFQLYNIEAPLVHVEERVLPEIQYTTVWEGYMMPNTYSQSITQNLDVIGTTIIDPISILKYVTIDKLCVKPQSMSYGDLIGLAISYVMLDSHLLSVERSVTYNGNYQGDRGFLNLRCQVSNFWDEEEKPSTAYEMIEEILRPFNMTLVFTGQKYVIYNTNKTTGLRIFDNYELGPYGSIVRLLGETREEIGVFNIDEDWIPNNSKDTTIEINSTYNSVTGICSTSIPSYSKMVGDIINYNQTKNYEKNGVNVQTNKSKGYQKIRRLVNVRPGSSRPITVITPVTEDKYYYIWNGVYVNEDYDLEPYNPIDTTWYLNVNKLKTYLDGTEGYPADYGSVLNFYGGIMNPTATGKEQTVDKSVEVKKRITAYYVDNGTPLEFLEPEDIIWTYNYYGPNGGRLVKSDTSASKWGESKTYVGTNRKVYHQEYENVVLSEVNDNLLEISLAQSFSRTGVDTSVDVMQNNTATDKTWGQGQVLQSATSKYFPDLWNSKNVKVNPLYFNRYTTGHGSCTAIWDETRVDVYVKLSDDTLLQFNGIEWVSDNGTHNHPFYLGKLMNNTDLYHTDHRYNCIRSSANSTSFQPSGGNKYALTDDDFIINYDKWSGVIEGEGDTQGIIPSYKKQGFTNIINTSEGNLSIRLPYVEDSGATVYVDVYNAGILGMNGNSSSPTTNFTQETFYYSLTNDDSSTQNFREIKAWITFLPYNVSYIKGEHLDLKISITVPETNMGQVFTQSDIKYAMTSPNNYIEEYVGPTFKVNTYNELVNSSWSYIMWNTTVADPGEFIINGVATRPEWFTIQAYYNWLCIIRKVYATTLKPLGEEEMNNIMKFITSEIGENPLMVISDSWDVKSNRHSIVAVECQNLDVDYIRPINVAEIPRRARSDRFNLPTSSRRI